jgi:excisionase family DNA binding protein
MKLLNTVQDATKELGISRARLYELIASGEIQACKLGHKTVFRREELVRFAAALPPFSRNGGIRTDA